MCGSFTCSKNSLIALNILYVVVAVILIGVAGAAKFTAIVTSLSVVSGIIVCGVFLLMISIVGLAAAARHHQVLLFFYMVVLFIIFVLQFAIACACLAMNKGQMDVIATEGWRVADVKLKENAQQVFGCCGFGNFSIAINESMSHPSCLTVSNSDGQHCCPDGTAEESCCVDENSCKCSLCKPMLVEAISNGLSAVGGIGLFFSFTEILGAWIAHYYRNQIDPRANVQSLLQR